MSDEENVETPPEEVVEAESPTLAKIMADAYKVPPLDALPPKLPASLRKTVAELTEEELDAVLADRKLHQQEQAAYKAKVEERDELIKLHLEQLRMDLEEEFVLRDNPKAALLYEIASKYAEGDLTNLFGFYDDLNVLVK